VKAGVSDAIVSQVDFSASLGALIGQATDATTMPDSQNVLDALLGKSTTGRDYIVQQADGFSLRQGNWKYVAPGRAVEHLGPWSKFTVREPGLLFNLAADPGEMRDLAASNPDKLNELSTFLKKVLVQAHP
jgi:arylsulfatase A-like enzyme